MSDPYRLLPQHPLSNAQIEKEHFLILARKKARAERRDFWSAPLIGLLRAFRRG